MCLQVSIEEDVKRLEQQQQQQKQKQEEKSKAKQQQAEVSRPSSSRTRKADTRKVCADADTVMLLYVRSCPCFLLVLGKRGCAKVG